ncbi:MAG: 3-dehydroquinate synthase II [Thermodesulforhabdaceae bacterium]
MAKLMWLFLGKWDHDLVTSAIELGVDGIVSPEELTRRIKELGRITVVSSNGDLAPGKDVFFEEIKSSEDMLRILERLRHGIVCLRQPDWNIIAVENLVAAGGKLLLGVRSLDETRLALTILEKGVSGVLVETDDPNILRGIASLVKGMGETFQIQEAVVTSVEPVGLGDRVCVDMAMMLGPGEGLLVGDTSSFLFLVHGETIENPYAAPRPFRVNAGGVHAYTRIPGGKTRYLAELRSGDPVLVVSHDGKAQEAAVGRVKIERRPLLIIKAQLASKSDDGLSLVRTSQKGSLILQNAETIRLVSPSGKPISVVELKKGDRVLVVTDVPGRHFGIAVEETISEK